MKILVVDDNERVNKMLYEFFKIKGHDCTTTTNGRNGLELIRQQKFDVVILDLAMPDFSGFDVVDVLYTDKKIQDQKIIVLTASSITTEQTEKLLNKGVKTCLRKPVGPDVLLKTVLSMK